MYYRYGVCVSPTSVRFGSDRNAMCGATLGAQRSDFKVAFNDKLKAWTVAWNWAGGQEPESLCNRIAEYSVPSGIREDYEAELDRWVREGWLRPYDEAKLGPAKGLIPLLAVVQANKSKTRPVMDFRELNSHVDPLTADADVCSEKLREWRRLGVNTSILDLKTAYMQIHVHESLWPFQTVMYRGRRFCLTRLGFGLNIAPGVMKTVIAKVLEQDQSIHAAASPYVDDIYVNNDIVSAERVRNHLSCFGLLCKPPESVADGARVLGLWVWGEGKTLRWRRCNDMPEIPSVLSRRSVFSLCGKLVSHLPVCGWLRPAVALIKRRANASSSSWDGKVTDDALRHMIEDTVDRAKMADPARGRWDVGDGEFTVWADASSLATGVAIEYDGGIIEDASWLRTDGGAHINMAELDALIKGINMALAWQARKLRLKTDSQTVFHWVSDALSGKSRLRTRAASEMLIRRRLSIITSLAEEYDLSMTIMLVPSAMNLADALTRVPQEWLKSQKQLAKPTSTCGAALSSDADEQIAAIHHTSGHQGVDRSLYFARRANPAIGRAQVREVVAQCQRCLSIDPAPTKWPQGSLSVDKIWDRVGMDITHYNGQHFLTLIDHGPSRFTIWKHLRRQDSICVTQQLRAYFLSAVRLRRY